LSAASLPVIYDPLLRREMDAAADGLLSSYLPSFPPPPDGLLSSFSLLLGLMIRKTIFYSSYRHYHTVGITYTIC